MKLIYKLAIIRIKLKAILNHGELQPRDWRYLEWLKEQVK